MMIPEDENGISDEEYFDWYGRDDELEFMNEGDRREFAYEGYSSETLGSSLKEIIENSFDKMTWYSEDQNEQFAIGYVRVNSKPKKKAPDTLAKYEEAIHRVFVDGEQREQEFAIRKFVRENGYVKFHTVSDVQSSTPYSEDSFYWLKMMIHLCSEKGATLLYCDLGSIFKHPDFFALINEARKRGVKVRSVKSRKARGGAQEHIRKKKIFTKKGTAKEIASQRESEKFRRYPILSWKNRTTRDGKKIPTKLFNTFEHIFNGADPIYKYFLTTRTKDLEDPSKWRPVNDYDRNIANALHDAGHLTVEGYGWTKQVARKTREKIFEPEHQWFQEYCIEKFRILTKWEKDEDDYFG